MLIVRDPRDNIRRMLDRLDLSGDASSLPSGALAEINAIWRQILVNDVLDIESLTRRWNRAANVYLQHADHIHLVRYEDFRADKTAYIRSLAQRLDVPVEQSVASVVETQHQPEGNRSTASWNDVFGAENLSRIERVCADNMRALNYTP